MWNENNCTFEVKEMSTASWRVISCWFNSDILSILSTLRISNIIISFIIQKQKFTEESQKCIEEEVCEWIIGHKAHSFCNLPIFYFAQSLFWIVLICLIYKISSDNGFTIVMKSLKVMQIIYKRWSGLDSSRTFPIASWGPSCSSKLIESRGNTKHLLRIS